MSSHLVQLSTTLHQLSHPVHPLLPTIPILLPLHAARVSIAWSQARQRAQPAAQRTGSSKAQAGGKAQGGLQGLVGYLVLAFGGSVLTSLLLRTPPSILTHPYLVPLYTLIYLLFPSRLVTSLLPTFPLGVLLACVDAATRTLTITTLLSHPLLPTHPAAVAALAGLAVTGGGLLCSAGSLWNDDWAAATPPLVTALTGQEGLSGFVWTAMDVWSAGIVAGLMAFLNTDPLARRLPKGLVGVLPQGAMMKLVGGAGEWTPLETRAAGTAVVGALLVGRVGWMYLVGGGGGVKGMRERSAAPDKTGAGESEKIEKKSVEEAPADAKTSAVEVVESEKVGMKTRQRAAKVKA